MSFRSLLRHEVVVRRRFAVLDGSGDPTYDERGQPITELLPLGTWRCRIEPKTALEVAAMSQAGAAVSTHTIYGFPTDLTTADQLLHGTDVFEVTAINDAGGHGHHLEIEARHIGSEDPPVS